MVDDSKDIQNKYIVCNDDCNKIDVNCFKTEIYLYNVGFYSVIFSEV